jgi:hypothetical protein
MEKKIRSELLKMTTIMVVLLGLGIYAHQFVIDGIKAKAALNLSIFATFGLAAWLAFSYVLGLKNEVLALNALKIDYGTRSRRPLDPYKTPAIVFNEPELLGQGYRMITEELGKQDSLHLSNATVQVLLHDVDQRIGDRKSTIMYFSGLMVFLGLLGAFMGLMKTVHSVGDLIGGMDLSGGSGVDGMSKMIEGMKGPLNGMSVGFSSSLFGLMTSMVLGALERFMTSAMKTLRNEFEHWLSNIAELEGHAAEQAGGDRQELAAVTAALSAGSRNLAELQGLLRAGTTSHDETNRAIGVMAREVARLTGHVGQLTDPTPMLRPVAESVAVLARNQGAILDRMETLFRMAEHDRAALRQVLDGLDAHAHRHPPIDAAMLHAQVDRMIALQGEIAEREPVPVAASPTETKRDGLWARLRRRPAAAKDKDAPHLRMLAAQQERLSQDVRGTFDSVVSWLAGQREADRATLQKLAEDQAAVDERLSRLVSRFEEPAGGDARAQLHALSRSLGAAVEASDAAAAAAPADKTDRAA